MSQEPPVINEDDDRHLAAEYVLGVLDAPARTRCAERLASDAAFRAEVEAWEQRLGPLIAEVAPAAPPPELWDRIARTLEGEAKVVPLPVRVRVWDRAGPWRWATAASLAAAAALAVVVTRPAPPPPAQAPAPPSLAATLASADGKSLWVATIDEARPGVTVIPVGVVKSGGRTPELWIIPVGGAPQAVGLLAGGTPKLLTASRTVLSAARAKAVLAVSLEPPGGSPTGAPTGPVIASGTLELL